MPPVAEVAGALEDSPRFPTIKLKEDREVKIFVTQEGWQEREGRGRYLRQVRVRTWARRRRILWVRVRRRRVMIHIHLLTVVT
jgi:hypothetical protein